MIEEAVNPLRLSEDRGIWVWVGVSGWFTNGLILLPTWQQLLEILFFFRNGKLKITESPSFLENGLTSLNLKITP